MLLIGPFTDDSLAWPASCYHLYLYLVIRGKDRHPRILRVIVRCRQSRRAVEGNIESKSWRLLSVAEILCPIRWWVLCVGFICLLGGLS